MSPPKTQKFWVCGEGKYTIFWGIQGSTVKQMNHSREAMGRELATSANFSSVTDPQIRARKLRDLGITSTRDNTVISFAATYDMLGSHLGLEKQESSSLPKLMFSRRLLF